MEQKIIKQFVNFVRYHNAFAIGVSLVLASTFSAMASEDVRNAVIGEKIVTESGIDNSQLLAADLDNFDLKMTVRGVQEDSKNYYINYTYQTLAINNSIWQPVLLEKTLSVPKAVLASSSDLGFYAQEELGEVFDRELAYLKEVQKLEREKGQTQIVQTATYTGLIGLVLNPETKVLPGYEPVVQSVNQITETVGQPSSNSDLTPEVNNTTTSVCTNGANRPCSSEIGACRIGVQICENGQWGSCIGAVFPTAEICDGVDNDCDGLIDEDGVCAAPSEPIITTSTEPIIIATTTPDTSTTTATTAP